MYGIDVGTTLTIEKLSGTVVEGVGTEDETLLVEFRKGNTSRCALSELPRDADIREAGRRTNEDHLRPEVHVEAIDRTVQQLEVAGITTAQVATFSHALAVTDGFTTACLRSQDSWCCIAWDASVKECLKFILPFDCENSEAQKKAITGLTVTHLKGARRDRSSAVILVISRALRHLSLAEKGDEEGLEKGYELCAEMGPFDHKRKLIATHT